VAATNCALAEATLLEEETIASSSIFPPIAFLIDSSNEPTEVDTNLVASIIPLANVESIAAI